MGQKNSILHAIARETIKVQTNAHHQNSLPGQDLTLKIVQKLRRIYETVVLKNVYPLRHGASFYPSLVSFRLQITHIKVRNLQKVLISL